VTAAQLKVLYIAGVSHCGSTFLGTLLGQLDGVFFAGELAHAARSLERDTRCGCGERLRECPVWAEIFARAPADALRLDHEEERARAVIRHVLRERGLAAPSPNVERAVGAFAAAYRAIAETTGSRVVVDSSKSPAFGRLLESVPGIELYVLHLVRDPRATAWSWQKTTELHVPPRSVALIWDLWNPVIEVIWGRRHGRYLRLRYEDFAARPAEAVARVARFLGESPSPLPFSSPHEVTLAPTHGIAGNPGKHAMVGPATIRRDDDWIDADGYVSRRTVAALTWPVRLRYGYR